MKNLPQIHVCEFAGFNISYRLPLRRARNYWVRLRYSTSPYRLSCLLKLTHLLQDFLNHIHRTFDKPWERYNVHLHLDNETCKGRVSSSEWEAGGYFEAEFLVDNKLVLFAHFEEMEPEPKTEDGGEAWSWGWLEEDSKDKVCRISI